MQTKTEPAEYTFPLSEILSLGLYANAKPHNSPIAGLQKGLILINQGTELIGEGTGFGVPVVCYRDKTYFSGSSTLQVFQHKELTIGIKQFAFDMLPEKWFRKARIENKTQRRLSRQIADLYQKHMYVRHTFETLKLKNLSRSIGVRTNFVKSEPIGNVSVTYCIKPPFVHVKADFEQLKMRDFRRIFLLNEQGSQYFQWYWDSDGTVLHREKIGAWESVTGDWACLSNDDGKIGFRLWQVKGAVLRRGTEFLQGALDWSGLDYEIDGGRAFLEYDIEVLGGERSR